MAKKKSTVKSKKEVTYVASGLNINYYIPVGLISMLATAAKIPEKDVWLSISNISNICAARLLIKMNKGRTYASSWTTQEFPNTKTQIRIDMSATCQRQTYDHNTRSYVDVVPPRMSFVCRIKLSGNDTESFTQKKIDDYITSSMEESLLGMLDDIEETDDSVGHQQSGSSTELL